MLLKDLHLLPKFRDGLSYLYVEHCKIEQEAQSIALYDADGKTPVPCASLSVLMLGPGTSISHAAVLSLADNGCLAVWCGEEGVRFYAQGTGESRNSRRLIQQARLASHPDLRLKVVRRMYERRFPDPLSPDLSLEQIRGMEGIRVRTAYSAASRESGVPWEGRNYDRKSWKDADPVNKALSVANSCLYGICHAGIVSMGYSPALGFIHTGKQLSFVYDVADLYKADISIPIAFGAAVEGASKLEQRVRYLCRDWFRELRLLARIADDLEKLLDIPEAEDGAADFDGDPALPGEIWDPKGNVSGGINFSEETEKKEDE
jgi:CRISPR-associated protein Cas1